HLGAGRDQLCRKGTAPGRKQLLVGGWVGWFYSRDPHTLSQTPRCQQATMGSRGILCIRYLGIDYVVYPKVSASHAPVGLPFHTTSSRVLATQLQFILSPYGLTSYENLS